jgi:hypothetical protein
MNLSSTEPPNFSVDHTCLVSVFLLQSLKPVITKFKWDAYYKLRDRNQIYAVYCYMETLFCLA